MRWKLLAASLLFATGCSAAHADRVGPVGPRTALAIAPAKIRAPYDVQILTESGETAPTYAHRDRFYVQGTAGERYIVRVTNPTARRIEAVVSVDGLDVVDGEAGDLRKRGYVVPPYGEVRIEGFRTSQADVATFRFSSVANSYAGKKGKARNVGVIAVAIFEEAAPPPEQQIIVPHVTHRPHRPHHPHRWDLDAEAGAARDRASTGSGRVAATRKAEKRAATAPAAESSRPAPPPAVGGATGAPSIAPRPMDYNDDIGGDYYEPPATTTVAPRTHRPGLGTEFGESRYSAASYTKFVRAANRPIAIAELRYNDTVGLVALGIPVQPMPDDGEIMMRETADPFPGDQRFSRPPGR